MTFRKFRKNSGKKIGSFLLTLFPALFFSGEVSANEKLLQSGPMLGYSEMKEVLLWVQTNKPAKVHFDYWEKGLPVKKRSTKKVLTSSKNAFVAKLIADQVEPGKKYEYELYIDSVKVKNSYPQEFQTQSLWQHRTDPPSFKVVMGSCAYVNEQEVDRPGKPYGGEYEIFSSIFQKKPDFMLWLGDNTYLREVDWYTRTGIFQRYTHTRSLPELKPLFSSVHHYAIWDDHDYGPNDSDRSFREKDTSLEAFKLFWGNQSYGTKDTPGIFTKFEWSDSEFFLLDNRYYRTPNNKTTEDKTILGEKQFQWLIDSLLSSKATFKFLVIGGQVLNPVDKYENYSVFSEEQKKLLTAIQKEEIEGVVFLTGDRHASELSVINRSGTYPIYDFTVSPLTASPYNAITENNTNRINDTYFAKRNFGLVEVSGPKKERKLVFYLFDKDGKEVWSKEIKASELKNQRK